MKEIGIRIMLTFSFSIVAALMVLVVGGGIYSVFRWIWEQ